MRLNPSGHGNLGKVLVFLGVLLGVVGGALYPTATTTRCDNGNCVTTAPGLASYLIAAASVAAFVLGAVLAYLAWRRRPRDYAYP